MSDHEVTRLWEALSLFDVVAEAVGLGGWDHRPPPAPDGMVRADPVAAPSVALTRARGNVTFPGDTVVHDRARTGAV